MRLPSNLILYRLDGASVFTSSRIAGSFGPLALERSILGRLLLTALLLTAGCRCEASNVLPQDSFITPFGNAVRFVESIPLSAQQFNFAVEEPATAVRVTREGQFVALDGVPTTIHWWGPETVRHFRVGAQAHLIGDRERHLYLWESDTQTLTPLGRGEPIRVLRRGFLIEIRQTDNTSLFDVDVSRQRLRLVDRSETSARWGLERFGVIEGRLVVGRTEYQGLQPMQTWLSVPAMDRPAVRQPLPETVLSGLPGVWELSENFAAGTRLLFSTGKQVAPEDAALNTEASVGRVLVVDWATGRRHQSWATAILRLNFSCMCHTAICQPIPEDCPRRVYEPVRAGWCASGESPFETHGPYELRGQVFNCVMDDSELVALKRDIVHTPSLNEPGAH